MIDIENPVTILLKEKKSRKKREPTTKKREPNTKKKPINIYDSLSLILPDIETPIIQITKIKEKKSRKKREPKNKTAKLIQDEDIIEKKSINILQDNQQEKMSDSIVVKNIENFKKNGIKVLEKLNETELSNIIQTANDIYYNENRSVLTDNEYDIIKEYIEKKHPKIQAIKEIGAPIQGKNKVILPFEMASMDKIKPDSGALSAWTKKYAGPYVISCKLDGVSGMYVCDKNGKYKLYTRGNGIVGQDISHLIDVLKLPKMANETTVRGEFILPKSIFTTKYASEFANARNLVSGIINKKSTDQKSKDLRFVTYEVIEPVLKPSEQFDTLQKIGHEVVMNKTVSEISNEMLSELLLDWRANYEYEIDGIIVSNDDIYERQHGNPDHSFAFKMVMSDQVAEAKVVDVIWEASKDGYLKPRIRIEPIHLAGVRIEYATGFNGKFIEDNKIGIGALIMMVRSGDVIPYIKSVTFPADKPKMPDVPYIWNKTHVDVLLENPTDDITVQEKNVTMFFVTLEVDGLAKGNIKKLFKIGKTSVPAILKMTVSDFEKVEGFKTKMSEKIYESIQDKINNASLLDIMVASGKMGRGLGERKIKPILERYSDILLVNLSDEEKESRLKGIDGIGKENAHEFVKNIPAFLQFLKECNLENKLQESVKESGRIINTENPLFGKKIIMTKVRDKEIIDFIHSSGGIMEETMKKDIFVLIVKSKSKEDASKKTEFALKNNIPIMTIEEFKEKYMT